MSDKTVEEIKAETMAILDELSIKGKIGNLERERDKYKLALQTIWELRKHNTALVNQILRRVFKGKGA
jgi:hypothetical protein